MIEQSLNGPLADPLFWNPSKVQLLLGIEVLAMLMMDQSSNRVSSRLISQQTAMGNMIFGRAGDWVNPDSPQLTIKRSVHVVNMQELDRNIQKFWQFEDLALCTKKNAENDLVHREQK